MPDRADTREHLNEKIGKSSEESEAAEYAASG